MTAFWKDSDKRRNCSKQAISSFVTMFSTLFNKHIFIYVDFPFLCQVVFNVVCLRFLVCWKWLTTFCRGLPKDQSYQNILKSDKHIQKRILILFSFTPFLMACGFYVSQPIDIALSIFVVGQIGKVFIKLSWNQTNTFREEEF